MTSSLELSGRISLLLSDTLGAFPAEYSRQWKARPPLVVGLYTGLIYAVLFCALPWLVFKDQGPLFWLAVWGSCYLAFAAVIARTTSSSVLAHIENRMLPWLSDEAVAAIDQDLARRFNAKRVSMVSFLVAIVAVALSAFAIHHDQPGLPSLEIAWSCCGYFILYLTAARTTYVARFYGTFASHLKLDADRIYALDPARSRQVAHIASVAQRILLFWFGIVCSVATLYPLFSHDLPWFVIFVVPTASFFSVGFGTIIFLRSEDDIRSVVKVIARSSLNSLEKEIEDLFSRRSTLDEPQWERLRVSMAARDQLIATGSYRSAVFSWLNILGPLALPLVPPAIEWWKKRFG